MRNIVFSIEPGTEMFRAHLSHYENIEDEQALMDEGGGDEKIVAFIALCCNPAVRAIEAVVELDELHAAGSSDVIILFHEIFMAGRRSVKQ